MATVEVRLTIRPGEVTRVREADLPQLACQGLIAEVLANPPGDAGNVPDGAGEPGETTDTDTTEAVAAAPGEPEGTSHDLPHP